MQISYEVVCNAHVRQQTVSLKVMLTEAIFLAFQRLSCKLQEKLVRVTWPLK